MTWTIVRMIRVPTMFAKMLTMEVVNFVLAMPIVKTPSLFAQEMDYVLPARRLANVGMATVVMGMVLVSQIHAEPIAIVVMDTFVGLVLALARVAQAIMIVPEVIHVRMGLVSSSLHVR